MYLFCCLIQWLASSLYVCIPCPSESPPFYPPRIASINTSIYSPCISINICRAHWGNSWHQTTSSLVSFGVPLQLRQPYGWHSLLSTSKAFSTKLKPNIKNPSVHVTHIIPEIATYLERETVFFQGFLYWDEYVSLAPRHSCFDNSSWIQPYCCWERGLSMSPGSSQDPLILLEWVLLLLQQMRKVLQESTPAWPLIDTAMLIQHYIWACLIPTPVAGIGQERRLFFGETKKAVSEFSSVAWLEERISKRFLSKNNRFHV